MGNDVKINIIAQDSTAPGISSVESNLQAADATAGKLLSTLDKIKAKSQEAGSGNGFKELAADAVKAQNATDKLGDGINTKFGKGNQVLTDMGRIIQDMPYGIQGIGNNIQPLVESFGRAKDAAGSTGGAVQAIISSLAGPVGLAMVGIPIVTSLAIVFGKDLVASISSGSESVEQLKARFQGIEQYKDFNLTIKIAGLEGIAKLRAELNQLIEKKAYLEGSNAVDAAVNKTKVTGGAFASLWTAGDVLLLKQQAAASAQNISDAFYTKMADSILKGEKTLSDEESVRILKKYKKMTDADATYAVTHAKVSSEVAAKDSEIAKQAEKDAEKAAKAVSKTTTESYPGWNSYATAINSANAYLYKSVAATQTIEEATTAASTARTALTAATEKSATTDAGWLKIGQDISDAKTKLAAADENAKKLTEQWTSAQKEAHVELKKGEKLLGENKESTLSVADALARVEEFQNAINQAEKDGDAGKEALIAATIRHKAAVEGVSEAYATQQTIVNQIESTISSIGTAFESMTGQTIKGLSQISAGVTSLYKNIKNGTGSQTNTTTGLTNTTTAALQTVSGVGTAIGGGVGSTISSAATSAIAGASTATTLTTLGLAVSPIVGAAVSGGISLISSIFGGSGPSEATNQSNATSVADSVSSLADGGNLTAQGLMKKAGYSTYNLSNMDSRTITGTSLTSDLLNRGYKSDYRLITVDAAGKGKELTDELAAIGKIEKSINGFANTSVVSTLNTIDYKYETIKTTLGDTAEVAKAKISEIISTLVIKADTVGTNIASAFSSYSGYIDAGTAAATKIRDVIVTSIQAMAISDLVNNTIMPILTPVLTSITEKITSGVALTTADYAGMSSALSGVTSTISPLITSLYSTFSAATLLTSSQVSLADSATTAAAATTTLADSLSTAKTATTSALSELKTSIEAQKTAVNAQLTTVTATITSLTSLSSSLTSTLNSMSVSGSSFSERMDAEAQISASALQAKTLGTLPLNGELTNALSVVSKDAASMFSTELEYKKDLYTTNNNIQTINDVASKQLTNAQKQQQTLNDQLTALDDIYNNAVTQVNALNGIDNSVKSVTEAVSALAAAILSQKTTQTAVNDSTASKTTYVDPTQLTTIDQAHVENLYTSLLGRVADTAGMTYWTDAMKNGASVADVATGIQTSTEYKSIKGHASGGSDSGWIMAGEGSGTELINLGTTEARIYTNKQSQSLMDLAPLIASNEALKTEMILLQRIVAQGNLKIGNNTRLTRIGIDAQNVAAGVAG